MKRLKIILIFLSVCFILTSLTDRSRGNTTLDHKTLETISQAVFEVVVLKPTQDSLSYERPLPLDLIPYSIRTDLYIPIGTAFAIGSSEFISAAHVLSLGWKSQFGEFFLRDREGKIYHIDKIMKYSEEKDFTVFSLKEKTAKVVFKLNKTPQINQKVYAVGNALGEGIVIRDGLYTSLTPEQEKGEWKWIRFSAAASPGNSGGPLLDETGKVIGIVLRKSPNENLNYALPIHEVLEAKSDQATAFKRIMYLLDNSDLTATEVFKKQTVLPRSYPELNEEWMEGKDLFYYHQLKHFFKEKKDDIFPNGKGSKGLFYKTYSAVFPNLIMRGPDGNWDIFSSRETREAELPNNGRLRYGYLVNSLFFYIQKPDNIPLEKFYSDSKQFMDLILKGLNVRRNVGSENIQVVSLGKSFEEDVFKDTYGRKWLIKTWLQEYNDEKVVTLSLPVPGGCITLMRTGQTGEVDHGHLWDLKMLANFIYVSYTGTLDQWAEFMKMKDLLPDVFSSIDVSFDYGKLFAYRSKRLSFSYPQEVMGISAKSFMKLMFSYFREKEKTVWDVTSVVVGEDKNDTTSFRITRDMKPLAELSDTYQSYWKTLADKQFPFNHSAYYEDKATVIAVVPDAVDTASASLLHTVQYQRDGKVDQKEMRKRLDRFLEKLTFLEGREDSETGAIPSLETYHDSGEYYQALYDLSRLPRMNPRYADGYLLRGELYLDKKNPDSALLDLNRCIELDPKNAQAYAVRGDAYLSKQDKQNACANWKQACILGLCDASDQAKKSKDCE